MNEKNCKLSILKISLGKSPFKLLKWTILLYRLYCCTLKPDRIIYFAHFLCPLHTDFFVEAVIPFSFLHANGDTNLHHWCKLAIVNWGKYADYLRIFPTCILVNFFNIIFQEQHPPYFTHVLLIFGASTTFYSSLLELESFISIVFFNVFHSLVVDYLRVYTIHIHQPWGQSTDQISWMRIFLSFTSALLV